MNVAADDLVSRMRELRASNHLIDDHGAMQAAWDRDGYLFFRDVLDHEPLERLRQIMLEHLASHGFVNPGDPTAKWNGKPREGFTFFPVEQLNAASAAKMVMEDPRIRAFFHKLFSVPLYWVPFTEYRTTPPAIEKKANRFDFVHEDAIYSDRLDFIICWIPLSTIDADVGGLAVAEGVHKLPCLHKKDGDRILPIDPCDVAESAWTRTQYQVGDVLLMSRRTPHSGLANHSDRFRLSMDTRILPKGGSFPFAPRLPLVGSISALTDHQIVIRHQDGREYALRRDATSYIRGFQGNKLSPAEVAPIYKVGTSVIAAYEGDLLQTLRPVH